MTLGFDRAEYLRLIDTFPPVKVRSVDQAGEAETRIKIMGLAPPRAQPPPGRRSQAALHGLLASRHIMNRNAYQVGIVYHPLPVRTASKTSW